jgi:hypothetical protein
MLYGGVLSHKSTRSVFSSTKLSIRIEITMLLAGIKSFMSLIELFLKLIQASNKLSIITIFRVIELAPAF